MPLVFAYGTLQDEKVQIATFGRLLRGHPDELVGFELSSVRIEDPKVAAASGKTHHANVTFNGREDQRVSGMVFEIPTPSSPSPTDTSRWPPTRASPRGSRPGSRPGCTSRPARLRGRG